jgi:probable F420-dependent oxidoreductase
MKGGEQPTGPDGYWLEPLTALAVISGMTSQIRLRTEIMVAALRRPVVLAKSATTLDILSGGRLDLGVGVGWQREEYEAAGLGFEGRGHLLDHTIEVCQRLWREQSASFSSPLLTFSNIHQMPKPVHEGGVPVWVSGTIRNTTVRRLMRFGMRWIPWGDDSADLVTAIPRLKDAVAAASGSTDGLQVSGELLVITNSDLNIRRMLDRRMDLRGDLGRLPRLVEAGVTDFVFTSDVFSDYAEAYDYFRNLVVNFRTAVGREVPPDV